MIFEAPFTSAVAVGEKRYWYMPVRLLMKINSTPTNASRKATAPLLILHGVKNQTVPFTESEPVFALANKPEHIVKYLDGGHETPTMTAH